MEGLPQTLKSRGGQGGEVDFTAAMTHEQRLNQVRFIARLMDDQFALPGTNIRFGLDSILGLFPGLGDALTSVISLLIVHHA